MSLTDEYQIKSALRRLWLYSKERTEALRASSYCCQDCGVKASRRKGFEQKLEVHHVDGINTWKKMVEIIRENLLCSPDKLRVLCPECHKKY